MPSSQPTKRYMHLAAAILLALAGITGLHRISAKGNPVEKSTPPPVAQGRSSNRSDHPRGEAARPPDLADELLADAARSDPAATLERARALTGTKRNQALAAVAEALAETSPAEASTVVEQEMDASEIRNAARMRVISLWAERDPLAAAACIEAMPADTPRARLVDRLLAAWPDHQRELAVGWIEGLPPGPLQDQSTAALARRLERTEAADSVTWIASFSSPAIAEQLRQALAR